MLLQWRRRARRDLDDAIEYVFERNPAAARRLREHILERVQLLMNQPGLGRRGRLPNSREIVISGTPYIVSYEVNRERGRVYILNVRHGARRWPPEFP